MNDAATDKVLSQQGRTEELAPLGLSKNPELKAVLDAVDFEDLLDG